MLLRPRRLKIRRVGTAGHEAARRLPAFRRQDRDGQAGLVVAGVPVLLVLGPGQADVAPRTGSHGRQRVRCRFHLAAGPARLSGRRARRAVDGGGSCSCRLSSGCTATRGVRFIFSAGDTFWRVRKRHQRGLWRPGDARPHSVIFLGAGVRAYSAAAPAPGRRILYPQGEQARSVDFAGGGSQGVVSREHGGRGRVCFRHDQSDRGRDDDDVPATTRHSRAATRRGPGPVRRASVADEGEPRRGPDGMRTALSLA